LNFEREGASIWPLLISWSKCSPNETALPGLKRSVGWLKSEATLVLHLRRGTDGVTKGEHGRRWAGVHDLEAGYAFLTAKDGPKIERIR
jgi:hypothetical protein